MVIVYSRFIRLCSKLASIAACKQYVALMSTKVTYFLRNKHESGKFLEKN